MKFDRTFSGSEMTQARVFSRKGRYQELRQRDKVSFGETVIALAKEERRIVDDFSDALIRWSELARKGLSLVLEEEITKRGHLADLLLTASRSHFEVSENLIAATSWATDFNQ